MLAQSVHLINLQHDGSFSDSIEKHLKEVASIHGQLAPATETDEPDLKNALLQLKGIKAIEHFESVGKEEINWPEKWLTKTIELRDRAHRLENENGELRECLGELLAFAEAAADGLDFTPTAITKAKSLLNPEKID